MNYLLLTNKYHQSGFVLLFAVIVATIIMLIGFGIFSISYRESQISGTSEHAMRALYAADSGVECALYFQTAGYYATGTSLAGCDKTNNITLGTLLAVPDTTSFMATFTDNPESCASVTVTLVSRIIVGVTTTQTQIISEGYSHCSRGVPLVTHPSFTKRVLEVTY